jgi:hypothetical protein
MLNPTTLMAEALGDLLESYYRRMFGTEDLSYATRFNMGARLIIEQIANSDALYHDVQHTIMVTIVGQEIFRGRFLKMRLMPEDWLHFSTALLCHDIGYIRGICPGDTANSFVIDEAGNRVTAPRGASDAFLTPYHVDRGKILVRHRFGPVPFLDEERVCAAIELTRFPVPVSSDHQETDTEAALVRAADLIGQLADPNYPQKLTALYREFVETGVAEKLGYETAADLVDAYPSFYWNSVKPYIAPAVDYLLLTQEGKQWVSNLHSHVFAEEHGQRFFGPSSGVPDTHDQE